MIELEASLPQRFTLTTLSLVIVADRALTSEGSG